MERRPAKRLADAVTAIVVVIAVIVYVLSNWLEQHAAQPDPAIDEPIEQLYQAPGLPPDSQPAEDLDKI